MPSRLRLAFAGTPEFAVPHLHACATADVDIVAVYTQPDRPAGRGRRLSPSPVKVAALAQGIPVEQPQTLRDAAAQQRLRELELDLLVVVAYGLILPRKVLALPRRGCWNVHASLLPRWRGAAPIQRALLAGDTQTGVCLMQMEAGLDTGPVLLRKIVPIGADDTAGNLHDQLAQAGAQILTDGLQRILQGREMPAQPQPAEGATYAHKLEKSEASLDWNEPADALERKVRAFDPWPVAEALICAERMRIWRAQAIAHDVHDIKPGTLISSTREGIDIACSDGVLRIHELQRAGGRRMSVADYLNAHPRPGNNVK